jgi:transposase
LVLMALYSVRSCRQFSERLRYDLLFKWFLDLNPDKGAFDATVYSKGMERFEKHEVSEVLSAPC